MCTSPAGVSHALMVWKHQKGAAAYVATTPPFAREMTKNRVSPAASKSIDPSSDLLSSMRRTPMCSGYRTRTTYESVRASEWQYVGRYGTVASTLAAPSAPTQKTL
jgi:hypothetical protein